LKRKSHGFALLCFTAYFTTQAEKECFLLQIHPKIKMNMELLSGIDKMHTACTIGAKFNDYPKA